MATAKQVGGWARANPNQLIAVGVSILVLGASLWVGMRARVVANDLATRRRAWQETSNQLATVQQQFRVPTSTESAALIAESRRLGALGVPESEKLNLIDSLGRLAEACALGGVRVGAVAASDSAYVTERQIAGTPVRSASYAVAVEFAGSFANAVKFVSSLPPSVSLTRMSAARRDGPSQYQLILSVYELDANPGD